MATALAGPRRARPPALPAAARVAAPPTVSPHAAEETWTAPYAPGARATAIPPAATVPESLRATVPMRRRTHRARWFVLGIAFGAIGAVALTGDACSTIDGARAWGARTLRSLEKRAPCLGQDSPATIATTDPRATIQAAWVHADAPCPMEPGSDDPCVALLAPFANSPSVARPVPLVKVDDLPRVRPPSPVVVARRPRGTPGAGSSGGAPAAGADGAEETAATPTGINPYADDPQGTPTRATVPTASPPPTPVERPLREPPASELPFTASAG
jgi:hypothetical protein